jgi:ABC-type branched-subunit amino acid transport system substrate-binding protein
MSDSERIFISYSTKDGKDFADELRKELTAEGFSIWQDLVALRGDQDWWTQIEAALKSKARWSVGKYDLHGRKERLSRL